jgi:hypothetical protein
VKKEREREETHWLLLHGEKMSGSVLHSHGLLGNANEVYFVNRLGIDKSLRVK